MKRTRKKYIKKKIKKEFFHFHYLLKIFTINLLVVLYILCQKTINNYYIDNIDNKFINIIPKVDNNIYPKNIKEIFDSRRLYISDANITNEYIHFIRPVNTTNETKKQKIIDKEFTENYFIKRNDLLNYEEYGRICIEGKLINENEIKNYKKQNLPFISVIVALFNKEKILLNSIRSIQNQSLKNIEIIIVNDASTDNSSKILDSLLEEDSRIRVFTHLKNMGAWRTRIDGFLYSKAKYVIHFDCEDLYYDNYVLEDIYDLIEKYNLDNVKTVFRTINSYKVLKNNAFEFENLNATKILYNKNEMKNVNSKILGWYWGVIWNRLILSDIYTKGLYLLSDRVLNIYKNLWEDRWWTALADKLCNNLLIIKRYGYLYYYDKKGEGTIKMINEKEKDKTIHELINFLYFDYDMLPKENNKSSIIKILYGYDKGNSPQKLEHFKTKFYILDDLLTLLIRDSYVNNTDKIYLKQLLNDSLKRQNKSFQMIF